MLTPGCFTCVTVICTPSTDYVPFQVQVRASIDAHPCKGKCINLMDSNSHSRPVVCRVSTHLFNITSTQETGMKRIGKVSLFHIYWLSSFNSPDGLTSTDDSLDCPAVSASLLMSCSVVSTAIHV